jgi:glutamate-1-semialdehyde 2,1-aminomutase
MGNAIMEGLRAIAAKQGLSLQASGFGTCFNTYFGAPDSVHDYHSYKRTDLATQQKFLAGLVQHGVRPTGRGTWFVSASHSETDVAETLDAVRAAAAQL